jgi:hypothetical protein
MNFVLHPLFAKAIYNKTLKLRVVYYDSINEKWNIKYGTNSFSVQNSGSRTWKVREWNVAGAPRVNPLTAASIIEKGSLATATELNSLNADITISSTSGSPIFHLVELDRSTTFTNMYELDRIITSSEELSIELLKIKVNSAGVEIDVADPMSDVQLFNSMGQKIFTTRSVADKVMVNLHQKGVYIVKNGGYSRRFIY